MNIESAGTIAGALILFAGAGCRWLAAMERAAPPERFRLTQPGWWVPPLPRAGEFATSEARRREVTGRVLFYVGPIVMLAATVWTRLHGR